MHLPGLGEAVTLAYLAGSAVPLRPVVAFDKGGVDGFADNRLRQRSHDPQHGAEDHGEVSLHHPPFLPRLVYRGVLPLQRRHFVGGLGAARFARVGRHHLRTRGVEQGGFRGRVFVTGAEIPQPATRAGLKVLAHLLAILCAPLARYDPDYHPMLGAQRDMSPIVARLGIGRVLRVAVLFFLAHKGPLVAELPCARLRGKLPLTRPAGPGQARPPARRSVPPARGLLPPGDRAYAPPSPRR